MSNITQINKVSIYLLLDYGSFTVCMEYRTCILPSNLGIDGYGDEFMKKEC